MSRHIIIQNNLTEVPSNLLQAVKKVPIENNYVENLDKIIDLFIKDLSKQSISSVTIPITLTDNPLDFSGFILGHHIRLDQNEKVASVPLIYYSTVEFETILKLTPLANILLTNGVYFFNLVKFSFEQIAAELENIGKHTITINEFFLQRISIQPPANYASHHSIDNELALLRWSEFIGCSDTIPEIKENIKTNLYFKYHQALNPLLKIEEKSNFLLEGNGKVLLIDDEAEKGWKDFYQQFLRNNINNKSIEFDYLNIDFNSITNQSEIVGEAKRKVSEFSPDVVLLDLRLCDKDFSEQVNPNELTGIQVLKEIKEINKGIQVIITTASNKAWNHQIAQDHGADGYIIKQGNSDVKEDIRTLRGLTEKLIKRAKFLIPTYKKIQNTKNLIKDNQRFDSENDTVREACYTNLDLSFELLYKATESDKFKKYYNYAYLQIFHCIEDFLKIKSIFEYGDKCYVDNNIKVAEKAVQNRWDSIIQHNDAKPHSYWTYNKNNNVTNISTDFKMSSVLMFLFNMKNSNVLKWPEIRDVRNKKAAHPEREIVTEDEISILLDFLVYIFNKEKINRSKKYVGLSDEISEESIQKLKEKLGSK